MVNPDIHETADRAKAAYARITVTLAARQYRTAELAGTGRLDPEEAAALQDHLHEMANAATATPGSGPDPTGIATICRDAWPADCSRPRLAPGRR